MKNIKVLSFKYIFLSDYTDIEKNYIYRLNYSNFVWLYTNKYIFQSEK